MAKTSVGKNSDNSEAFRTLIEVLSHYAVYSPDKDSFVFLQDGGELSRITHSELLESAHRIGAYLSTHASAGDRVVLCYPSGLEYV